MIPSPRPRSTRQAQAGLAYAVGTVARANPVVVAYRWRYESAGATVLAACWATFGLGAGTMIIAGAAAVLVLTAVFWPGGRSFLAARAWVIITPHRVRVGCAQAWIHSRNGKIPIVLLTRPQPAGERVYLWCRAGTSTADFTSARGLLSAACWADDVYATRHPRYAHLVMLDVIHPRAPSAPAAAPAAPTAAEVALAALPQPRPADDGGRAGLPPQEDLPSRRLTA